MHISEGFLPLTHCVAWGAASLPAALVSVRAISKDLEKKRENRVLLAASAAFLFTLSALRLPRSQAVRPIPPARRSARIYSDLRRCPLLH